jgi:hypothetical protein
MNKRGLSTIVTSVILILLVLVVIGVVWVVINNVVKSGSEEIELGRLTVGLDIDNAYVQGNNVIVQVTRDSGSGNFGGVKFIFSNESLSESAEEVFLLEQLDSRTFTFPLTELDGETIEKVSIALFYESDSGKIIFGEIIDIYKIQERELVCIPSNSCEIQGASCGSVDDGCGNNLNCGSCTGDDTCGQDNQCYPPTCVPETDQEACVGADCGDVYNNCGDLVNCVDTCAPSDVCVSNSCCAPNLNACTNFGAECGSVTNDCGNLIPCTNTCTALQECVGITCEDLAPLETGTIENVWPPGVGIYFDSDDLLKQDGVYFGYVAFFPIVDDTQCFSIIGHSYDLDVYLNSIVELDLFLNPLAIITGSSYEVWESRNDCETFHGI